MDMWGPACIIGQDCERYFLLVVDDYTRYTMRFRKALLVLRLHSDRGGEFSSDLLRDFCRGEGILQLFMLPASPQKNGIAEICFGLVMEVARTSMILAAAPYFLWPFAVQYAAHQLNLWPHVSLSETSPALCWTGEVGNASVFRDVTFDKSVPFFCLFPYRSPPPPPPPLFLGPGPPLVDPLPPQGPAPSGVSQVDPLPRVVPVEVAVDSGAARGAASGGAASGGAAFGGAESVRAEPGGAELEGAGSGGAEPGGAEPGGAELEGAEPGGAELEGAEPGGAASEGAESGAAGARGSAAGGTRAGGVGAPCLGGTGVPTEARGTGGAGAAGPGGAGAGGVGGAGARGARARGAGAGDPRAGGAGSGGTGAGGLELDELELETRALEALGLEALALAALELEELELEALALEALEVLELGPDSLLPTLSPYAEQTDSFTERREPESRRASPVRAIRTGRRVPRPHPPPLPCTHVMALRPSSVPLRVPLLPFLESSLPVVPDPASDLARATRPTVSRLLATVVPDPSLESTAASSLVAELVDLAAACRLDYATSLVAKQEDFECLAAAVPHLVDMLLAPKGDLDARDIPTLCSYAEAIMGPYSSQWQTAMDAEMASWKTTGAYIDAVPPSGVNIVDGMWIFRVKRPPGSPPVFKARYVARGFSQRQGVDFFQTFSPTPKMTTLWVVLHVAS
ncbi:unnamed protein product [Closterium sp. NIES-54]